VIAFLLDEGVPRSAVECPQPRLTAAIEACHNLRRLAEEQWD
jgi:hypothetical protein